MAKASSQELLLDYEGYLRTHGHRQWEDNSAEVKKMRHLAAGTTILHFTCPWYKFVHPKPLPILPFA